MTHNALYNARVLNKISKHLHVADYLRFAQSKKGVNTSILPSTKAQHNSQARTILIEKILYIWSKVGSNAVSDQHFVLDQKLSRYLKKFFSVGGSLDDFWQKIEGMRVFYYKMMSGGSKNINKLQPFDDLALHAYFSSAAVISAHIQHTTKDMKTLQQRAKGLTKYAKDIILDSYEDLIQVYELDDINGDIEAQIEYLWIQIVQHIISKK